MAGVETTPSHQPSSEPELAHTLPVSRPSAVPHSRAPVRPLNATTPPFWFATHVEPTPTITSGVPSSSMSATAGLESMADAPL